MTKTSILWATERRMLIVRAVAAEYGVAAEELFGPGRTDRLCEPRWRAMLLIRVALGDSYPRIGAFFGGRDHTSCLYAVARALGLPPSGKRTIRPAMKGFVDRALTPAKIALLKAEVDAILVAAETKKLGVRIVRPVPQLLHVQETSRYVASA